MPSLCSKFPDYLKNAYLYWVDFDQYTKKPTPYTLFLSLVHSTVVLPALTPFFTPLFMEEDMLFVQQNFPRSEFCWLDPCSVFKCVPLSLCCSCKLLATDFCTQALRLRA